MIFKKSAQVPATQEARAKRGSADNPLAGHGIVTERWRFDSTLFTGPVRILSDVGFSHRIDTPHSIEQP